MMKAAVSHVVSGVATLPLAQEANDRGFTFPVIIRQNGPTWRLPLRLRLMLILHAVDPFAFPGRIGLSGCQPTWRGLLVGGRIFEPGRDQRDSNAVAKRFVERRSVDDLGVFIDGGADDLCRLARFQ